MAGVSFKIHGQNVFSVSDDHNFQKVKFSICATDGQCFIESGEKQGLLNIQRSSDSETVPTFEEKIVGNTKEISVKLNDREKESISATISRRMFSKQSVDDYTWKVYLSKLKPMDLDLTYAVGDTYIDLSDLPIEKLKMKTGSANVKVNYKKGLANQLKMDTFMIRVDMGTFEARNLHLSRSENIIADVGFGSMHMDFGSAETLSTNVTATVGAGRLEIILPPSEISVRININDSPLCRIKIPKDFAKSDDSEYLSNNHTDDADNFLTFNIDVAVGNIVFVPSKK